MRRAAVLGLAIACAAGLAQARPDAMGDRGRFQGWRPCALQIADAPLDGQALWDGACVEGQANGTGVASWSVNGETVIVFEGSVDHGVAGRGRLVWYDGVSYEGEFKSGKRDGDGRMAWPDGRTYVGNFEDGFRAGTGMMLFPNGNRYLGRFAANMANGKGSYQFANGDRYEGDFVDDAFEGQGKYTFKNGSHYEGEFRHDHFEGHGVLTAQDGRQVEGDWHEDLPRETVSRMSI